MKMNRTILTITAIGGIIGVVVGAYRLALLLHGALGPQTNMRLTDVCIFIIAGFNVWFTIMMCANLGKESEQKINAVHIKITEEWQKDLMEFKAIVKEDIGEIKDSLTIINKDIKELLSRTPKGD